MKYQAQADYIIGFYGIIGHRVFKERRSAKGEIYMTKRRKKTQEERAEIAAFCIEDGKDYGSAIILTGYDISRYMLGYKNTKKRSTGTY